MASRRSFKIPQDIQSTKPKEENDITLVLDLDETLVHITSFDINDIDEDKLNAVNDRLISFKSNCLLGKNGDETRVEDMQGLWGLERPYLKDFLNYMMPKIEDGENKGYFDKVIIWTAGTQEYAFNAIKCIFADLNLHYPLVWSREKCVVGDDGRHYKPLDKLVSYYSNELDKAYTIIIDDRKPYIDKPDLDIDKDHHIFIKEYTFDPEDEDSMDTEEHKQYIESHMEEEDTELLKLIAWLGDPAIREEFKASGVRNSSIITDEAFDYYDDDDTLKDTVRNILKQKNITPSF